VEQYVMDRYRQGIGSIICGTALSQLAVKDYGKREVERRTVCSSQLPGSPSSVHNPHRSKPHWDKIDHPLLALAAGTRLGPYEILVPIGAGGMGGLPREGYEAEAQGARHNELRA
jgi:hypothetical protein